MLVLDPRALCGCPGKRVYFRTAGPEEVLGTYQDSELPSKENVQPCHTIIHTILAANIIRIILAASRRPLNRHDKDDV